VELGEPFDDLTDEPRGRRPLVQRGEPHVAERLEQTPGPLDLFVPGPGQVHVAEQHAVEKLPEERLAPAGLAPRLHVGREAWHDTVPGLDLSQLLLDLSLGAFLPEQRMAL